MVENETSTEDKPLDDPREELFCQVYVNDQSAMGNATRSYARANEINIERLEGEEEITWKRRVNVVSSASYDELRKPRIKARLSQILLNMMNNGFVDGELTKIIAQSHKLDTKLGAIREFNRLKQRILDKVDVSTNLPMSFTISESIATKIGLIGVNNSNEIKENEEKPESNAV